MQSTDGWQSRGPVTGAGPGGPGASSGGDAGCAHGGCCVCLSVTVFHVQRNRTPKTQRAGHLGASNLGLRPSPSWESESKPISVSSVTEKMSEGLRCAHQFKSERCGRVGPAKAFPSSPHMVIQLRTTDLGRSGRLPRGSPSQGFAGGVLSEGGGHCHSPCLATFPFPVGGRPRPTAEASCPLTDQPDLTPTRLALRSRNGLHVSRQLSPSTGLRTSQALVQVEQK